MPNAALRYCVAAATLLIGGAVQKVSAFDFCSIDKFYQDIQYHTVTKTPTGKYLNENGTDYVSLQTMFIGLHGWRTDDPRAAPPAPNRRKVEFYKAYLEASESGRLFDQNQKHAILDKIDQLKKAKKAVYVVAFVHGWHHNAYDKYDLKNGYNINKNPVKFQHFAARYAEHVRRLFELNGDSDVPAVVAIYVGWRGESSWGHTAVATVGDRAAAADQIARADGDGTLKDAFTDIAAKMRDSNANSRMLLVGYSLGGRMLSMMFLNDITQKKKFQPLGKQVLIVALQPAISADCYRYVFSGGPVGARNAPPSFIAFTSEHDIALSKHFRNATHVPRLLLRIAPPSCGGYNKDEHLMFTTTIGNYEPYLTHRLIFRYQGDLGTGKPYPRRLLNADGKTTRFPLVDDARQWLYNEGTTIWFYPYFKLTGSDPDVPKNYINNVAALYTLTINQRAAWRNAGAVWNVQTDKNLIDTAEGSIYTPNGKMGALHNAFASTGVADILSRLVYASKEDWPGDGGLMPPPVVPEPNRRNTPDAPRASGAK